jgi:hypothetical protein
VTVTRDREDSNGTPPGAHGRARYVVAGQGFATKAALRSYRQRVFPDVRRDTLCEDAVLLALAASEPRVVAGVLPVPDALSFRRADDGFYKCHMRCDGAWFSFSLGDRIAGLGRDEAAAFEVRFTRWLRELSRVEMERRRQSACAVCGGAAVDVDHVDPLFMEIARVALGMVTAEERESWFGYRTGQRSHFGPAADHPIHVYAVRMAREGKVQSLCKGCHVTTTSTRRSAS